MPHFATPCAARHTKIMATASFLSNLLCTTLNQFIFAPVAHFFCACGCGLHPSRPFHFKILVLASTQEFFVEALLYVLFLFIIILNLPFILFNMQSTE
jgi:hypothetical protein